MADEEKQQQEKVEESKEEKEPKEEEKTEEAVEEEVKEEEKTEEEKPTEGAPAEEEKTEEPEEEKEEKPEEPKEAPEVEDETEKEFIASVKAEKAEPKEEEKTEEQKEEEPKEEKEEEEKEAPAEEAEEKEEETEEDEHAISTKIFALRTTANREDQVMDFISSNVIKKKIGVYSIIRPHGMRGYIFLEANKRIEAEQAAFNVPYARGVLPNEIQYKEIEHMLEQVKKEVNIQKNDIVELISGPFKREKAKVSRIDKTKEEVVVELLEAAVPIPITVRLDAVKVIRRESEEEGEDETED